MTLIEQLQSRYQNQLLPALPAPVRELLQGNSFRQLLAAVDTELLLFGDQLCNLQTGQSAAVIPTEQHDDDPVPLYGSMDAQAIAGAAARLCSGPNASVALYLAPCEFIGTQYKLPGLSREAAQSALGLQSDTLFPGVDIDLSIAVTGNLASEQSSVALWLPSERLDSLFAAFAAEGLFLTAVAPRVLAVDKGVVIDRDTAGSTLARVDDRRVAQWLHISAEDLKDEALSREFTEAEAAASDSEVLRADSASSYPGARPTANDGSSKGSDITSQAFVPTAALSARKKVEQRRNLGFLGLAVLAMLGLAALPFVSQSLEFRKHAEQLELFREQSVVARENQAAVIEFEDEWGVIADFPEQNVTEAMFKLQNILLPDQLASLELNEGLIRIQGTSAEPQGILQRLEQDPMFTEVVFSRATSNSRYYIDLRLSEVNFEAYRVRYFPDD